MKMNKPQKPSAADFKAFAKQIHDAGLGGVSAAPLLQRNAPMRRWLEHILDYLPPELAREQVVCGMRGRGVVYRPETDLALIHKDGSVSKVTPKAAAAKIDPKDWKANAAMVPAAEWAALARTILAGDITGEALLTPYLGTPIFRACWYHPDGVPDQLAKHGVILLRNG
jgi:hypothetical protein